jgi:hypothetical protein
MDNKRPARSAKLSRTRRSSPRKEVRCAVRFPLSLAVVVTAGREEKSAFTRNVSANGVLFDLPNPLKVGQGIDFSLLMPGEVLGAARDVTVPCGTLLHKPNSISGCRDDRRVSIRGAVTAGLDWLGAIYGLLDDSADGEVLDAPVKAGTIRIILADSQAIYRVGIRKVFALEDDLRVVAQADSLENLRGH